MRRSSKDARLVLAMSPSKASGKTRLAMSIRLSGPTTSGTTLSCSRMVMSMVTLMLKRQVGSTSKCRLGCLPAIWRTAWFGRVIGWVGLCREDQLRSCSRSLIQRGPELRSTAEIVQSSSYSTGVDDPLREFLNRLSWQTEQAQAQALLVSPANQFDPASAAPSSCPGSAVAVRR